MDEVINALKSIETAKLVKLQKELDRDEHQDDFAAVRHALARTIRQEVGFRVGMATPPTCFALPALSETNLLLAAHGFVNGCEYITDRAVSWLFIVAARACSAAADEVR